MKVNEITNSALGETVFEARHPSGLTVLVMPKQGYSTSYAAFAARYGSIDNIIMKAGSTALSLPAGTAHFLEHKLFESEELNAFERFAKTGASANAYTSFDMTAYVFSCAGHFRESLDILLDFVSKPFFTQETVEKEQGIIGQEIGMYNDDPGWQVFFGLLKLLYPAEPVGIDIAGTPESIAQITAQTLYECYRSYYHPANMALAAVGDVSVQQVLEAVDALPAAREGAQPAKRLFAPDYSKPEAASAEKQLAVSMPRFMLGFKERMSAAQLTAKQSVLSSILLDIIAGKASVLYRDLIAGRLANPGFSSECFSGHGYCVHLFGGDSPDPQAAAQAVREKIASLKSAGIDSANFERSRRNLYGQMIMMYNSTDNLANALVSSHFAGQRLFDEFEACKAVTLDDINQRLEECFDENLSAVSIVSPLSIA